VARCAAELSNTDGPGGTPGKRLSPADLREKLQQEAVETGGDDPPTWPSNTHKLGQRLGRLRNPLQDMLGPDHVEGDQQLADQSMVSPVRRSGARRSERRPERGSTLLTPQMSGAQGGG